ncbi:hypothetical protein RI844_17225 [Thalassotalea fonticola]|uniref:Anti-sigma factor n=1 Tax=Thalassotalea fonticola TaxID=3065649 RepID=A0ABZ0GNF4_9GAMM|nr:hypothetical protein RI844_17225 [Colwelliaceae bacterium S1-1]
MNKSITDQQLQTQIDNLAKEIKPERDLWAGIEHAIEHNAQHDSTPKKTPFTPYAWAASVALAVVLTWNLNTEQPVQVAQVSALDIIVQQYGQEKNSMLVSFGEPDIKALPTEIQEQFNELDSARKSLIKALADDPDNADLLNLLKWTQQQELNLIEHLYSPQWQTI